VHVSQGSEVTGLDSYLQRRSGHAQLPVVASLLTAFSVPYTNHLKSIMATSRPGGGRYYYFLEQLSPFSHASAHGVD
jgi:hypothetical protein